jgi:hypothetical protein
VLKGEGAPLPEGAQIVSLTVGPENLILKLLRGKVAGLKYDILPIITAPIPRQNPSFLRQVLEEARPGKGGEVAVIDPRETVRFHERDGPGNGLPRIPIEAEDERGLNVNPPGMDFPDRLVITNLQIDPLADASEHFRRDGFEADEKTDTAAAGRQGKQLGIVGDGDGTLGDPSFPQGDHGGKEFPGHLGIGDDVVVGKDEKALGHGPDLFEDLADGTGSMGPPKERAHGAEGTAVGTAARHLDRPGNEVFLAGQEVPPGMGDSGKIQRIGVAIDLLESSVLDVPNHLGPKHFSLADDHGIAIPKGLFREGGRVNPAHDDRDAPGAEMLGQGIGPRRGGGHGGDSDEIRLQMGVDLLDGFIDQTDLHLFGRHSGQKWEGHRGKGEGRPPPFPYVSRRSWRNENHTHRKNHSSALSFWVRLGVKGKAHLAHLHF